MMGDGTLFDNWEILWTGVVAGLLAAAVLYFYPWGRARLRFAITGFGITLGWLGWNFVLDYTKSATLDRDGSFFSASWQDAGSGIVGFTIVALLLGIREHRQPAGTVIAAAFMAGMVAFIWDIRVL